MQTKYNDGEGDPYVVPGTDILKNLSGIRDPRKAQLKETADALHRNAELNERPVTGNFDLDHLKAIHKHLFQDSYAWAGETRTIDIAKGSTRFGSHPHIESYSQKLFAGLAKERAEWRASPGKADLPDRLAWYMSEINAMHPFREGNGRTQRVFIGQLAAEHGLNLKWENADKEKLLQTTIASMTGSHKDLAEVIRGASDKTRLAELKSGAADSRLYQHENQSRRADALEDGFAKRVAEHTPPAGKEDIEAFMKAMKAECPGHSAGASQGLKAAAEACAGDSAREPQFRQAAQKFRDSAAERLCEEQSLKVKNGPSLKPGRRRIS